MFTDLERIIYDSAQKDADPEHRTFFVGITRAKEKLFITNQDYEYQYSIGAPIIWQTHWKKRLGSIHTAPT